MTALHRLPGWRARFEAVIDEIKARPFAWRDHDCGPAFTGRLVEAVTGADLAAPYRGRYSTERGALLLMRREGFDTLADFAASLLPEIHPSRATIADLAAVPEDTPFGFSLGAVNGERILVLRPDGLGTVDLLAAKRAFKVG